MPGLVIAVCAEINLLQSWAGQCPCLLSGCIGKHRRCSGRWGWDALVQVFIGEDAGAHLVLVLPLLGGDGEGRSSNASLLLSLSSLSLSRSSTSCWSCLSSLLSWVLI